MKGRQCGILVYADDINILGLDSQDVKIGTKDLIIIVKTLGYK